MDDKIENHHTPRYVWPWFVLAAVLLAIALAVVWMSFAVKRTREQRDPNTFPSPNGQGTRSESSSAQTNKANP